MDARFRAIGLTGKILIFGMTIGPIPLLLLGWFARTIRQTALEPPGPFQTALPVALVCTTVATVVLSLLLSRHIMKPVRSMLEAADRLAEGDLSARVPVSSSHELGALSERWNELSDELDRLTDVVRWSAAVTDEAADQVSSSSLDVERSALSMEEVATQLIDSSGTKGRTIAEHARAAGLANERVAHLSSALEYAITEVAQAGLVARTGQASLYAALDRINALSATLQESSRAVHRLSNLEERIGSITRSLQGIAAQTRMLSLNAAIEASRAGVQNRGFTQVADEVRRLAGDSSESAAQIAELIAQLHGETLQSLVNLERGARASGELGELVARASASLSEVQDHVARSDREMAALSAASLELTGDLRRMANYMESMAGASRREAVEAQQLSTGTLELTHSLDQMKAAAGALAGLADELRQFTGDSPTGDEAALPSTDGHGAPDARLVRAA